LAEGEFASFEADVMSAGPNTVIGEPEELPNGSQIVTYTTYTETPVTINLQGILNGIMPQIIPMIFTLCLYMLMARKKFTPVQCILLLLIIGLIGAGPFGLWPSIWA
jgi:PTS system N-acetylgalactosamine-specific IID component